MRLPGSRRTDKRVITLPVGEAESRPPRPRVLICDDNESVTQLLDSLLRLEGWAVEIVSNGEDFLVRLSDNEPDVAVLDQTLGPKGVTGLEAASIARDGGFDRPIVLFSAYLDVATRARARELDLLEVSKVDFLAVIRQVTAAHAVYTGGQPVRSARSSPAGIEGTASRA